ncbi:nucleoside hydrolase [Chthonobacter rhizosphaerae]|uniref:nucleoside hydrolase n=1 Tax=Chthonobacter rhizosphaerae TaxID=2735553 RepID=UPI0015EE7C27|nr:nucleoside hydrolase [Chthonobacter rhizosphaerae]
MAPRSIIIDTDPGQDDAVAIMLALGRPDAVELLGLTAVAGNVPLHLTVPNCLKLLELAGRTDIPVFAGASAPLMVPLVTAEHVHGKTGLDGWDFPEPTTPIRPEFAPDWIVETVMSRPEKSVTLLPLGPLTNVALALAKEPRLAERLESIILMGGACVEGGNITPTAEFNIFVDPHAAARVFASGADIVVLSLDATHQAQITNDWLTAIKGLGTRVGVAFEGLLTFYERFDTEKYGTDGGPLHDPMTVAHLLAPHLFTGKRVNVEVETTPGLCFGQTVVDRWAVTDRPKNATWVTGLDSPAVFDLILDAFRRLP